MTDSVNNPKHYSSHPSGVRAIELCRLLPFSIGNAVKYLMRAGLKESSPKKEDLFKAAWYLNDQASDADFCISTKAMRVAKKIKEAEPYGTSLYCLLCLLANLSWDSAELARLSSRVENEARSLKDEEKRPESYDVWQIRAFKAEKNLAILLTSPRSEGRHAFSLTNMWPNPSLRPKKPSSLHR